jgi:hypothetical protein
MWEKEFFEWLGVCSHVGRGVEPLSIDLNE